MIMLMIVDVAYGGARVVVVAVVAVVAVISAVVVVIVVVVAVAVASSTAIALGVITPNRHVYQCEKGYTC